VAQPSLFPPEDLDGAEETFTVSELADLVNGALRRAAPQGIWVRGEVHGYSKRGDHAYFDLVERTDTGQLATIGVVLFGRVMDRIRPQLVQHRLRMRDGITVRLFGAIDFYAPQGRLRVRMLGLDTLFTLGQLAADRDQLLRRLAADGLLARQGRLRLPPAPVHLGVITRYDSAAWHDLHDELVRSGYGFRLSVVDVRVQGHGAEHEVAAAIATLGRLGPDVVVLVRGGGSRTDLATFDTEVVARAVAACPIPVVTGLGHETDRAVADDAAHLALKTPTACAGALVERRRTALERVEAAWAGICDTAMARLDVADARVLDRARRLDGRTMRVIGDAERRLGVAARTLTGRGESAVAVAAARLDARAGQLARRAPQALDGAERAVEAIAARVRAADPAVLLARGWSITRDEAGHLVTGPADAPPGAILHTVTAGGTVVSVVPEGAP
jgi:exodeoxyribonuclease VII large subunit